MRFLVVALAASLVTGCGHKSGEAKADTIATSSADPQTPDNAAVKVVENHPHLPFRVTKADALLAPLRADLPQMKDVAAAEYPEAGIDPINPSCEKPWTVIHAFKGDHKSNAEALTAAQALLVNRAFKVIDSDPHAAGEVVVEIHAKGDDSAIIARCHDAGTCTRLAGMIKAVTKWDTPRTGCGDLPNGFGASTRLGHPIVPVMPQDKDTVSLCARLGACKILKDPGSSEDPVGACQKSPSSFNTTCALKSTCEEVLACH